MIMLKSVLVLFSGSLLGKLIGFFRELLIAWLYGITAPVGAFRMSQSATLIPVNFFTSDSLNAGFIPLYKQYKKTGPHKAQSLFWTLKFILLSLALIIAIGLMLSAPWWLRTLAPGFDLEETRLAVTFTRIMALGVPFYILGALYSYMAMANDIYVLSALRPSIQSVGMILGVCAAYYLDDLSLFAWGFTGAYIFFSLYGWRVLVKHDLLRFSLTHTREILAKFWRTVRPLLLLPFMLQGNIMIERIVSSLMGVSVVASVEYAKFITETGIVLIAVPLGLVGLSTLSALDSSAVKKKLTQIIPVVLILMLPVSLFIYLYADGIVTILFKRGAFDRKAVTLTGEVLAGLALGFWAQVASYVLLKALNAQHRNREVVIFMGLALSANALFDLFVYRFLGPVTIGIGASLYGSILFFLTIRAFQITRPVVQMMLWVLPGGLVYYLLARFFSVDGIADMVISSIVFVIYWLIYLLIIPQLRRPILPLISRLKGGK